MNGRLYVAAPLQAAGVARVVSRRPSIIDRVTEAAERLGIEMAVVPDSDETLSRRAALRSLTVVSRREKKKADLKEAEAAHPSKLQRTDDVATTS